MSEQWIMAQRERLSVPWRLEPSTDDRSDLVWIVYGERVTLPNGSIAGPSYILRTDPMIAEMIVNDHNAATRLADVESENARLAPVIAWIRENHVKKHDSDTLDVDHGPIVEWDYCDWCADHGLPEDWPCMFVLALATTPAATVGGTTTYDPETGCDTCGCPTLVDDRCWGCKRRVIDPAATAGGSAEDAT